MLIDGSARSIDEAADFVIVGSGAAGATAARWLTALGRSVVVVEEGAPPKPARGDAWEALTTLYRDAGSMAALGADVLPLLQGRCVGGTTVINGAIQVPLPEEVWAEWVAAEPRWATLLPFAALEAARERNDVEMGVAKTPGDLWGGNGNTFFRGMQGKATATWRNAPGCVGAGRCLQGCPHGAKQSVDLSMLPKAIAAGARVYARCKVERIVFEAGRAVGVDGIFEGGKPFRARASRAVFVAASAIQTPWLLARSGVKDVGVGFMCHPGAGMAGLFAREINGLPHATQAMESHAMRGEGFKLETLGMPRAFQAARVPGVGALFEERLQQLDRVAIWGVAARAEARGRVRRGPWGPLVQYTPSPADRVKLLKGLSILAEAMLCAEAIEVWPAVHGAPEAITTVKQARDLANLPPLAGAVPMVATHFFCGVRVDDNFQVNGIPALVAIDSSIFPSNIGVNPMTSIMAVATVIAERWGG
ncbi:MAG: GMC family oxidoreductase [Myxococcales bacterium]|nr:GMC family oxidoreductase [Myxococcales bacterium]